MLYHASRIKGITTLVPHTSNHERALVYLSEKRENVLVYLSNAVEKYCLETGFVWNGPWRKWASYGFTKEGQLLLEEYYPNATEETYKGVSGYVYQVDECSEAAAMNDIPYAYISSSPVNVAGAEFIPDAYEALLQAERDGLIVIKRYSDLSESTLCWLKRVVPQEFAKAENHPEYQYFLKNKFAFVNPE